MAPANLTIWHLWIRGCWHVDKWKNVYLNLQVSHKNFYSVWPSQLWAFWATILFDTWNMTHKPTPYRRGSKQGWPWISYRCTELNILFSGYLVTFILRYCQNVPTSKQVFRVPKKVGKHCPRVDNNIYVRPINFRQNFDDKLEH